MDARFVRTAVCGIICMAILGAGIGIMIFLIVNGPKATAFDPEERAVGVVAKKAVASEVEILLRSQGEVLPLHRTQLTAEVGGKLSFVHDQFEAGMAISGPAQGEEGELLLQIDQGDYEAAVAAAEATLAEARLALTMEEVRKSQALRDWGKIGQGKEPTDLVKRVPQIVSAKAKIKAAEAALEMARRDLVRTEIRAPYDCRLQRTHVDIGSTVIPGMPLADLVSRGPVEVRLPLSLEDYGYLARKGGSVVGEVVANGQIGGETVTWNGRIVRSEEMVERSTRSINVVAEFGAGGEAVPPVGMFVEASIRGRVLPEVIRVPHSAMIDGNKVLLVEEERLDIRPVKVLRTEEEFVLVNGGSAVGELPEGSAIVVTPPSSPVQSQKVTVARFMTAERSSSGSEVGDADEVGVEE